MAGCGVGGGGGPEVKSGGRTGLEEQEGGREDRRELVISDLWNMVAWWMFWS